MYWNDEGYLLSKNNFDENSIIIEVFTQNHGKYNGIVLLGGGEPECMVYSRMVSRERGRGVGRSGEEGQNEVLRGRQLAGRGLAGRGG